MIFFNTLSFRAAFFCSISSRARARRASRALSSCSLKGQSLGIPGSFSFLDFLWSPSFFASLAFFLWCSFTFLMILYFFFNETLLLLLSANHKQTPPKIRILPSYYTTDYQTFQKERGIIIGYHTLALLHHD